MTHKDSATEKKTEKTQNKPKTKIIICGSELNLP